MMSELEKRLNRIKFLGEKLDGIMLLSGDPNYFYFTNSNFGSIFYHDFYRPKIFTRRLENKQECWIKNIQIIEKIEEIKLRGKIGINFKNISLAQMRRIKKARAKFVDISEELEKMREIKTKYEIKCIKESCNISKKIMENALESWKGKTEYNLMAMIESEMRKNGCESAFPTIVAAGKNLANIHHIPGKEKIKKPFLIDMGVKYKGYHSDITRTIGSKYHEKIEKVIEKSESMVFADAKCSDVYDYAKKTLGKNFITGLGHGIGVEIHEKPSIAPNSRDVFRNDMTFTIEPGLYIRNGIRIENDYLLTNNRLVRLA